MTLLLFPPFRCRTVERDDHLQGEPTTTHGRFERQGVNPRGAQSSSAKTTHLLSGLRFLCSSRARFVFSKASGAI
jgi:hypothetical protein